jgi:hypothetical protein
MINTETTLRNDSIPQGRIALNTVRTRHSGNRSFEIYVCDDGFIELYDAENPKEGIFFNGLGDLVNFVNSLTEILDNKSD